MYLDMEDIFRKRNHILGKTLPSEIYLELMAHYLRCWMKFDFLR